MHRFSRATTVALGHETPQMRDARSATGTGERVMGYEGYERDVARPLYSNSQRPLVFGADAGSATRLDLGSVRNKAADLVHILVIDDLDMFNAEGADPASRHKAPPRPASRASTRSRSAWPPRRASAHWSGGTSSLWPIRRPAGGFSRHISPVLCTSNSLRLPG